MNLQQLRDYIRVQLDMDEEELPDALLNSYLDEGFTRTIAMEPRWPFYETRWMVAKIDGANIALPTDCDPAGIMSLQDAVSGARLMQLGNEQAEDSFPGVPVSPGPCYYSIFGREIVLWPAMQDGLGAHDYHLRGYRYSKAWIPNGPTAEPDCDPRLHQLLAHYAIALAYAQQEDEVLEDVYMKRWQASYIAAHSAVCQPRHHRPLIFNGGVPGMSTGNSVAWSNPPVAP